PAGADRVPAAGPVVGRGGGAGRALVVGAAPLARAGPFVIYWDARIFRARRAPAGAAARPAGSVRPGRPDRRGGRGRGRGKGAPVTAPRLGAVMWPTRSWPEAGEPWRRAEELGFRHAWVYDHIAWRGSTPWYDAYTTLSAA